MTYIIPIKDAVMHAVIISPLQHDHHRYYDYTWNISFEKKCTESVKVMLLTAPNCSLNIQGRQVGGDPAEVSNTHSS